MIPLAHYWGIDEVGVFVLPALIAIVLLRWGEKRAKRKRDHEDETSQVGTGD